MTSKNLILSIILLVAIVLSWWLVHKFFNNHLNKSSNLPQTPDGFMTDVHYVHYNQEGKIQSLLYSPKIVHYEIEDTALLTSPQLTINTVTKDTWVINALHGVSKNGITQVNLNDDVKVVRTSLTPDKALTLTTTALVAYPNKQYAETNQPVTIIQPGSIINSVGMTANLATGDIKLLSQAHGVYIPTPTPTPSQLGKSNNHEQKHVNHLKKSNSSH